MTDLLGHTMPHLAIGNDLLLITEPSLRHQLLQAPPINHPAALFVVQRGRQVYLSLPGVLSETERQEIRWAILRLQFGERLAPQELPVPLRSALSPPLPYHSPLIQSLIWGTVSSVLGGVMAMALAGLLITVLNVSTESHIGVLIMAAAFVLTAAAVGTATTIYFWRRFSRKATAVRQKHLG